MNESRMDENAQSRDIFAGAVQGIDTKVLDDLAEEAREKKMREGVSEISNYLTIHRVLLRDLKPAYQSGAKQNALLFAQNCIDLNFPLDADLERLLRGLFNSLTLVSMESGINDYYNHALDRCIALMKKSDEYYTLTKKD